MGLLASAAQTSNWVNCPEGVHQAVVCDVVDLGMVKNEKFGKEQHKCRIVFQTELRMEPNEKDIEEGRTEGRRYIANRKFTVSLTPQSHLLPFCQGLLGRALTLEEKSGFDIESLLGMNCMIQVMHESGDDGTVYANIVTALPNPKGDLVIENYTRASEREDKEGNKINPPPAKPATPVATKPAGQISDPNGMALTREQGRLKGLISLATDAGIQLKEVPESIKSNPVKLKAVNDAIQNAIEQEKAKQAAAAPDEEDFNILGNTEEEESFDPNSMVVGAETPAEKAPAKAAPAKTLDVKAAQAATKAHTEKLNPSEDDGENPIADAEDDKAAATLATVGLAPHHYDIALALLDAGNTVEGYNTIPDLIEAVNDFRADSKKAPITQMSDLTPAAAKAVLNAIKEKKIVYFE